jgi:hypothetical protein
VLSIGKNGKRGGWPRSGVNAWPPIGRKQLAPYRPKTSGPRSGDNAWPPIVITPGAL